MCFAMKFVCKILKNAYFEEHLRTTVSALEVFFNDFHQKCSTTIYVVVSIVVEVIRTVLFFLRKIF